MHDLEMIGQMPIRCGKTTAICGAAKTIGATVIVRNREEAHRVKCEYGVNAVSWESNLRGTRGPYLVDTDAVSCIVSRYEATLLILREENYELKMKVRRHEMSPDRPIAKKPKKKTKRKKT